MDLRETRETAALQALEAQLAPLVRWLPDGMEALRLLVKRVRGAREDQSGPGDLLALGERWACLDSWVALDCVASVDQLA